MGYHRQLPYNSLNPETDTCQMGQWEAWVGSVEQGSAAAGRGRDGRRQDGRERGSRPKKKRKCGRSATTEGLISQFYKVRITDWTTKGLDLGLLPQ